MRCLAIIEAVRPGLDCVIIWRVGERMVAVAYEKSKVTMTRPVEGKLEDGINEMRIAFQINSEQLDRVLIVDGSSDVSVATPSIGDGYEDLPEPVVPPPPPVPAIVAAAEPAAEPEPDIPPPTPLFRPLRPPR